MSLYDNRFRGSDWSIIVGFFILINHCEFTLLVYCVSSAAKSVCVCLILFMFFPQIQIKRVVINSLCHSASQRHPPSRQDLQSRNRLPIPSSSISTRTQRHRQPPQQLPQLTAIRPLLTVSSTQRATKRPRSLLPTSRRH